MKVHVTILLTFMMQFAMAQQFEVDTLLHNGDTDNRVNIVILGDGYQESELDKFVGDAKEMKEALFNETPYKEYQTYFNVFAIKVPSKESGASHPGTATDVSEPKHEVKTVNNYFGSTFDYAKIHRLLVSTKSSAISTVLALNFPSYDQVFILVNSPYYGGSGGQYAVSSTEANAGEVAIHEMGHSFGRLADEYYAGDYYAGEGINMTSITNPTTVKWKNWMNSGGVGIYQHCCGGQSSKWYRPHENCKMRYLGSPFCPVCKEATIERIHSLVKPMDSFSPQNDEVIELEESTTFEIELVTPSPNTLKTVWMLNGDVVAHNVDSVLVKKEHLSNGEHILQATIQDTSSFLRVNNHQDIHQYIVKWTLNSKGNTVSVDNIVEDALEFNVYPNPTQDVLSIAVSSPQKADYTVNITDVSGKLVLSEHFKYSTSDPQLRLGELPTGMYIVELKFDNGVIASSQIVKE